MIHKLSASIANRWVERGIVQSENVENYIFGLQLVLSGLINFAVPIGLSICLGVPAAWIPFMLSFVLLRMTAGGVHAKTQWRVSCFLQCVWSIIISCTAAGKLCAVYGATEHCNILYGCGAVDFTGTGNQQAANCASKQAKPNNQRFSCWCISTTGFFYEKGLFSYTFYVVQFYLGELSAVLSLIWAKVQGRTAG